MEHACQTVMVNLPGREYPIHVGSGVLGRVGPWLAGRCGAGRATIITDSNVGPLYADAESALVRGLTAAGFEARLVTVPAGEESKSLAQLGKVYDRLASLRHERGEPILAVGGGVVGDLAGFAAATWHRGVPFATCPTTLEAMIDAAIGGKTAINHAGAKNVVGAFHQPILVCADTACLTSLSPDCYRAGLAESVKHAVISGQEFVAWHEQNAAAIEARLENVVAELIRRNCEIKAAIVVADEREQCTRGVGRAALNFGHTVGHALEALSAGRIPHGVAVALGMVAEMELAVRGCGFPVTQRDGIEALLVRSGLPIRSPERLAAAALLETISLDKKVRRQRLQFIVPRRIGEMRRLDAPDDSEIVAALTRIAV